MKAIIAVGVLIAAVVATLVSARVTDKRSAEHNMPYDYRTSPAYASLSIAQRRDLAQVRRDLAELWGALDMYADAHDDRPPSKLDGLVPTYLPDLPHDPFATDDSSYHYQCGSAGNRAWVISSVGLADFPFLAERGNVGIYLSKGEWMSGKNPMVQK